MARLEILDPESQATYEISGDVTTIGRRPDNDVVLSGGTVSGHHARVVLENERFFLEDVGSRNGTLLNRDRVEGRVQLAHNDEIHFGKTPARFDNPPDPNSLHKERKTVYGGGTVVMGDSGQATLADRPAVNFLNDDQFTSVSGTVDTGGGFGLLSTNSEAKLKSVLEISQKLAGTIELDEILPMILETLLGLFPFADRGCILLKEEGQDDLVPRAMMHRRPGEDATIRLSRTIVNRVLEEKKGILSADAANDVAFQDSESIVDLRIRSMMCVPMLSMDGEPIGLISIDSQNQLGQFTNDDLDILVSVAGQAALSYESARLLASFVEKQKQDTEMQIAHSVQLALLPNELPQLDGYEFYASYDSARAIGGDYYDSFVLPNGKICISFGDVSGKGVPGALIMSRMHSCVQNTMQHVTEVLPAMDAINGHMSTHSAEGRFVTYILAILDPQTHELTMSNAGHPSPIIRRADGSVEVFDDDKFGPPICVMETWEYEAETKKLNPGDTVVIITDGVDEAMNEAGELYSMERVFKLVANGPARPSELGQALLDDVRLHAGGFPQSDDITIFVFGRVPD